LDGAAVFAKIVVVILALGLCAAALLSLRQMRTQAAHELAEARLRVLQRDNELWRLRAQIAEHVTPEHIQELAAKLHPLKPVGGDAVQPPVLAGPIQDQPR
jgi:hypothetical protein